MFPFGSACSSFPPTAVCCAGASDGHWASLCHHQRAHSLPWSSALDYSVCLWLVPGPVSCFFRLNRCRLTPTKEQPERLGLSFASPSIVCTKVWEGSGDSGRHQAPRAQQHGGKGARPCTSGKDMVGKGISEWKLSRKPRGPCLPAQCPALL